MESVVSVSVNALTVGAFQENCYLLMEPGGAECAIIDPGAEPERIIAAVERSGADALGRGAAAREAHG